MNEWRCIELNKIGSKEREKRRKDCYTQTADCVSWEFTSRLAALPEMRAKRLQLHIKSLSFNYLRAQIGLLLRSRDLSELEVAAHSPGGCLMQLASILQVLSCRFISTSIHF